MRNYRTPGIYFEEQDAGAPLIGPLRTDIAGFVGISSRGPLHLPVRIESRTQFASVFGGPLAQAILAYAVQGLFDNRGVTCWVVRVADPLTPRSAPLSCVRRLRQTLPTVTAGSAGMWGNGLRARW